MYMIHNRNADDVQPVRATHLVTIDLVSPTLAVVKQNRHPCSIRHIAIAPNHYTLEPIFINFQTKWSQFLEMCRKLVPHCLNIGKSGRGHAIVLQTFRTEHVLKTNTTLAKALSSRKGHVLKCCRLIAPHGIPKVPQHSPWLLRSPQSSPGAPNGLSNALQMPPAIP